MFFDEVSLVTGGFDPLHSGHLKYFKKAKELSHYLIVGLNSNSWLKRKKGQYFQSWDERSEIIRNLDMVNAVISYNDDDDSSCVAINKCLKISKHVIFCNGGDRGMANTPEIFKYGNNKNVTFKYGIGGNNKMNSSSIILSNYFNRQRKLLGI